MPNYGKHAKTGALVGMGAGVVINIIRQVCRIKANEQERFNWGELALYAGGGAALGTLAGVAPDLIEPATGPNHRALFHSLTTGTVSTLGTLKGYQSNMPEKGKDAILVSVLGLLSHLVLDSKTPKGLPPI